MIIAKFIGTAILAYILGAIPFALILGKLMGNVDITQHGSGNVGGTNVLRVVGTKAALIVVVLDVGKAVLAVFLARVIMGNDSYMVNGFPLLNWQSAQILASIMVMVGHNWSVFIKFRGGKGVATYFGSWLAMCPAAALFGGIIIIMIACLTRYVSMGSILGAAGITVLLIVLTIVDQFPPIYLVYSIAALILIVYQHRGNIKRLQTRTELRLGEKFSIKKHKSVTEPSQVE